MDKELSDAALSVEAVVRSDSVVVIPSEVTTVALMLSDTDVES